MPKPDQKYQVFYFQTGNTNSIIKFLTKLPQTTQAKIRNTIRLIKKFGPLTGPPHIKFLKTHKPLFEIRILGTNSIRLIAFQESKKIILLHIFKKKAQSIPFRELKTALKRFQKIKS
ncbi:type II toxin-antitoxin system RelE/ParE family toxin [Patescibacteria group bacterium]|nr:type II toxin-antitoxin system RelE/ParE family toxin [Patescibacteria group bacterium]